MTKLLKLTLFVILSLSTALLSGCDNKPSTIQHGYIEGKFTYVSSQTTGALNTILVSRGVQTQAGQALFKLDLDPELSAYNQAKAEYAQAKSELANLLKGKRPSELAAIEAQQRQIKAKIAFSKKTVERYRTLVKKGFLQKESLDQAVSEHHNQQERLKELIENLKTAKLKARQDEIEAAKSKVEATHAALKQAKWHLQQKTIYSPVSGQVFDTFYRIGEVVPANTPILSIIAPENIFAVFFMPEKLLASIALGQTIKISCDSCKKTINAKVSFISPKAEFTPPVIYSEKSRSKLVFRIEAKPTLADAPTLHPGQPITVDFSR